MSPTPGRPPVWTTCKHFHMTGPGYLQEAVRELGYRSFSEGVYQLIRDRVLADGNGLRCREYFEREEAGRTIIKDPLEVNEEKEIYCRETIIETLEDYIRSLTERQVSSMEIAVHRGNSAAILKYQEAIKARYKVWVDPAFFYRRFPEVFVGDGKK